jgi:hypothetical protein
MANVRIVLNRKGVREILRSPEVEADLERRARHIAAAAGPGHEVDVTVGGNRARASVRTDTFEAMRDEATDRNLTRALDAGRH